MNTSRFLAVFAALVMVCGCAKRPVLTVFFTGDMNRTVSERGVFKTNHSVMPFVASILKAETGPVILLDAGNWSSGISDEKADRSILEIMKKTGYDAAGLSADDTETGYDAALKLADKSGPRIIASNIRTKQEKTTDGFVGESAVLEKSGMRIGIISLLSGKASVCSGRLRCMAKAESANRHIAALRKDGVKIVVVINTKSRDADDSEEMAEKIKNADLIISGYRRSFKEPVNAGTIRVLGIPEEGTAVSYVKMEPDPEKGTIRAIRSGVITRKEGNPTDTGISGLVESVSETINRKLSKKVADNPAELKLSETGESGIGNWVADCLRRWGRTDFSFADSSMLDNGLAEGAVTLGALRSVFGKRADVMFIKMRGEDIQTLLSEEMARTGRKLQISGLVVHADRNGKGSVTASVNGTNVAVSGNKIYKIALPDIMLEEDYRYPAMGNIVEFVNTKKPVPDVLRWCAGRERRLKTPSEGRWIYK